MISGRRKGGGTCIHPTGQTNSPSLLWYLVVISTLWDQLLGYGNCYRVQSTVSIRETPGYSFSINRSMKKVFFFSFVLLIVGSCNGTNKKGAVLFSNIILFSSFLYARVRFFFLMLQTLVNEPENFSCVSSLLCHLVESNEIRRRSFL